MFGGCENGVTLTDTTHLLLTTPTHMIAWGRGPLAPIVRGATERCISTLSPYQALHLREDEGETISTDNEV